MKRQADSTIKGFLYQFNKSILEIIKDATTTVTVEGLIEDIDSHTADGTCHAIQCKYHESAESFNLSQIYKPVLQMLESFSNGNDNVQRKIFIHIPTESASREMRLTNADINEILKTANKDLRKIINRINPGYIISDFTSQLKIEFGPSLSELEEQVKKGLALALEPGIDVEGLAYPNALTLISKISAEKSPEKRLLTRKLLIENIRSQKDIAINKWTRYTRSKNAALKILRSQLSIGFAGNAVRRVIYIDSESIDNFSENIIAFICGYLEKYQHKQTHIHPPIFLLKESSDINCPDIIARLYKKGVSTEDGYAGSLFTISKFIKDPIKCGKGVDFKLEFRLRLCSATHSKDIFAEYKPDYLYIISDNIPRFLLQEDMKIHHVAVNNFQDLEYVMSLGGTPSEI